MTSSAFNRPHFSMLQQYNETKQTVDYLYKTTTQTCSTTRKPVFTSANELSKLGKVKHACSACLMLHAEVPPGGSFLVLTIPNPATQVDCVLEKQANITREYLGFSHKAGANKCRNLGRVERTSQLRIESLRSKLQALSCLSEVC